MAGIMVSGGIFSGSGDLTADWFDAPYNASGTARVYLPDGTFHLTGEKDNFAFDYSWQGSSDYLYHSSGTVKITHPGGTTININGAGPVNAATGRNGQLYNLYVNQNVNPRGCDPVTLNTTTSGGFYAGVENMITITSGTLKVGNTTQTNFSKFGHIMLGHSGTLSCGNVVNVNNGGYNNWDSSGSVFMKSLIWSGTNGVFVGNPGTITLTGPYGGNGSDHYVWENNSKGTYYHNSGTIQFGGGDIYGPGETSQYGSYINFKNNDRPADGTAQASNGDGGYLYNVSGGFRDQDGGSRHLGLQVTSPLLIGNNLGMMSGSAIDKSTYNSTVSGSVTLSKDSYWGYYATQGGTNTWGRLYMGENVYFKAPTGTLTLNKVIAGYTMYNAAGTFLHNSGTVAINFTGTDATTVRNQSYFYNYEQTLPAPTNRVNWRGQGDSPYKFRIANNATIKEGSFRPKSPTYRIAISGTLEVQSGGNYGYSGGDFEAGAVINKVDIKSGGNMYASTGTTIITNQFGNHGTFHNKGGTVFFSGSNLDSYFIDQDGGTHVDPVFYNLTYSGSHTYLMEDITVQKTFLNPSGYIRLTSDKTLTLGTATSKGYLDLKGNRMYPYGDSHIHGAAEDYPAGLSGTHVNPILWAYGEGGANHARLKWLDVGFDIDTAGDDDVTITQEGNNIFKLMTVQANDKFDSNGYRAEFTDDLFVNGILDASGSLLVVYDKLKTNSGSDIYTSGTAAIISHSGTSTVRFNRGTWDAVMYRAKTGAVNFDTNSNTADKLIIANGLFDTKGMHFNSDITKTIIAKGGQLDNQSGSAVGSIFKTVDFNNRGGLFASSSAVYLDGTGDYLTVTNNMSEITTTGHFTMESWFKATAGGGFICARGNAWGTGQVALSLDGTVGRLTAYGVGVAEIKDLNNFNLTDGLWHHMAGTYDGANLKLYIDGKLVNHSATTDSVGANTTAFQIGARGGSSTFTGDIARVSVWKEALTGAQIRKMLFYDWKAMDASGYYTETDCIGWWEFGEGEGATVEDRSASDKPATLVNTVWADGGIWTGGGQIGGETAVIAGNFYIGKHSTTPTLFASSYFDVNKRKMVSGSKFGSKAHMNTDEYYIATSGTADGDWLSYQYLSNAPIGTHSDVKIVPPQAGLGGSRFTFDNNANNEQCNTLLNMANSRVRIVDNTDFYTQDFDNAGTWERGSPYGGTIHDDGSTPVEHNPIDIMDDIDSGFDTEELID
jgi:hypothetical protein